MIQKYKQIVGKGTSEKDLRKNYIRSMELPSSKGRFHEICFGTIFVILKKKTLLNWIFL